jgi:hypothetical protein
MLSFPLPWAFGIAALPAFARCWHAAVCRAQEAEWTEHGHPGASGHGRNTRAPSQSSSLPETEEKCQRVEALNLPSASEGRGLNPAASRATRRIGELSFQSLLRRGSRCWGRCSTPPFRCGAARPPRASEFSAILLPSEITCHSSLPDCLPPMINAGWTANCAAMSMVARPPGRTATTSSALKPPLALPPQKQPHDFSLTRDPIIGVNCVTRTQTTCFKSSVVLLECYKTTVVFLLSLTGCKCFLTLG